MAFSAGDRAVAPGLPNIQVFSSSGTWTKPAGLRAALVQVQGGGGGGGGCDSTVSNQSEGGPGGAGGYSCKLFQASELSATETVTVGALGAGGVAGQNNGSAGGTSTFKTVTCGGGGGGEGSGNTASTVVKSGGTGGTASGGDINIVGRAGMNVRVYSGVADLTGRGGDSPLGTSGAARVTAGTGNAATGFGAGGGGAFADNTNTDRAGGNGSVGAVIVTTYM